MDQYLPQGRPHRAWGGTGPLFTDEMSQRIDPHRVSRAVKKYITRSGVDKDDCCHLFRQIMAR